MAGENTNGQTILRPAILLAGLVYAVFEVRVLDALPPDWQSTGWPAAMIAMALLGGRVGLTLVREALKLPRLIKMLGKKISHGSARWATCDDARKAGLYKNRGLFLGVHEGRVIRYENETHTLVVAPTGAGKTVTVVMQQLLLSRESMLVTDMKRELAVQTARARRDSLGHRIVTLNPLEGLGFAEDAYNVCQLVLDAFAASQEDAIADARAIALQLLRDPPQRDQNQFFRQGGREIIVTAIIGLAIRSPEECSLPHVQRVVTNIPVFLAMLRDLQDETALQGDISAMAESLLACQENTPREFQSFANGAAQVLAPYAPSGRLARLSDRCTFRFSDLKDPARPTTIYIGGDMTRRAVFTEWIALLNWAAMVELQRSRSLAPVTLLLDEAANFAIEALPSMLTILRGYKVRVIVIVQELEDLVRIYGREQTAVIRANCKVQIYFGNMSPETAERLQPVLGNETIETPSFGLGGGIEGSISENRGFVARPLATASELRQLEDGVQIVIIGNLPPFLCHAIGYHETWPNRWLAAPNPLHGNRRFKGTLKVCLWPVPLAVGAARRSLLPKRPSVPRRLTTLFLTRSVVPLMRLAMVASAIAPFYIWGMPHLRVSYTAVGTRSAPIYLRCEYLGWNSFQAAGPQCPLVVWRKTTN